MNIEVLQDIVFYAFVGLAFVWQLIMAFHKGWRDKFMHANTAIFIIVSAISIILFALSPDVFKLGIMVIYVVAFLVNQLYRGREQKKL